MDGQGVTPNECNLREETDESYSERSIPIPTEGGWAEEWEHPTRRRQITNDFIPITNAMGDEGEQQYIAFAHIVVAKIGVVAEGSGFERRERVRLQLITTAMAEGGGPYTITLWDDEARRVNRELLHRTEIKPK